MRTLLIIHSILCLIAITNPVLLLAQKDTSLEPPAEYINKIKADYKKFKKPEITLTEYINIRKQNYLLEQQSAANTEINKKQNLKSIDEEACLNGDVITYIPIFPSSTFPNGVQQIIPGWLFGASNVDNTGNVNPYSLMSFAWSGMKKTEFYWPIFDTYLSMPPNTPLFCIKIGNMEIGAEADIAAKKITINPDTKFLNFWYAVAFQDPGSTHASFEKPSFEVLVKHNGITHTNLVNLGNGSNKLVADLSNPFFQTKNGVPVKEWTCAQIDLSSFADGEEVEIHFIVEDCSQGAHWGYALIDDFCRSCQGSPTGNFSYNPGASCDLPGKICFDYELPKNGGEANLTLEVYQNSALVATFNSPTLTSGNKYCFDLTCTDFIGKMDLDQGFDFICKAAFKKNGIVVSSFTEGVKPAGMSTGINNDCKLGCGKSTCCDSKSYIVNGDFELGNSGFSSQYLPDGPIPSAGSVVPGEYSVLNSTQAQTVASTWVAKDQSKCNTAGKFLVVNGLTNLTSGPRTIWSQTIGLQTPNASMKLCFNVRNFNACAFNVKPKLKVLVDAGIFSEDYVVDASSPDACQWQLISASFALPAGTTSVTIKIQLYENVAGDGNDLAIDDISLESVPQTPKSRTLFSLAPTNPNTSTTGFTATITDQNLKNCNHWWKVCEYDPASSDGCVPSAMIVNPSQWWTYPTPVQFWGYNGTSSLSGTAPGVFSINKKYRFELGVWCDCSSWNSTVIIYDPLARKIIKSF